MRNSPYRSFIKDNAVVITGHILVYMKAIILIPLIIKSVGVTVYGGFVLLTSLVGIVFGLSSLGVGYRAKRFLPSAKGSQERSQLFYPQFFFHFLSILLLAILFYLLDNFINTHVFKNEITYWAWIIPFYLITHLLYSQGVDYFRYTSRVHYMTFGNIIFPYLHIVFILVFFWLYNFMNINVLMISFSTSALFVAIPCFMIVFKEIGVRFSFYSLNSLVSDIKLGFPLVLGNIVDFILAGSDRYLIVFYLTVSDVGYYNPGYVIGSLIIFIPKAMGTALPQLLSKAVDNKNEHEARKMLNYALKFFLLLAIPFIFGSAALGKPVLTFLASTEVAEKAYLITPIVAFGILFYGLNIILSNVLFVRLKTFAMFKMNIIAALFNLLANYIFLYFFRDIIVAAITTLLSYFLVFIYVNRIVKTEGWAVDYQPDLIIKSVFASTIMLLVLTAISLNWENSYSIGSLFLQLLIAIIVYIFCLYLFRAFSKKEIQFMKNFVNR